MFNSSLKVFPLSLASGLTSTADATDLGGHTWSKVVLEVPSFTSGGTIYVKGAATEDGTFHRLYVIDPADGAQNVLQISQASSVGGVYFMPALAGLQFVKIEVTTTITDAVKTFKFYCS